MTPDTYNMNDRLAQIFQQIEEAKGAHAQRVEHARAEAKEAQAAVDEAQRQYEEHLATCDSVDDTTVSLRDKVQVAKDYARIRKERIAHLEATEADVLHDAVAAAIESTVVLLPEAREQIQTKMDTALAAKDAYQRAMDALDKEHRIVAEHMRKLNFQAGKVGCSTGEMFMNGVRPPSLPLVERWEVTPPPRRSTLSMA